MNIRKLLFRRFCALVQVFLLLVNLVIFLPAYASSNDLSFSDLTKLSSLETVIYGSSYKNLPSDRRISSLERVLFGKVQKGTLPARLATLVSTINGEHNKSNLLSPPIAPELDRSDALTNTATPPIAPQAAGDSNMLAEEMPPTAQEDRIKVMLQQAAQLYSQGQTNQAETIFKDVLSLDRHNVDANFNLGAIAESRSDWQNALQYYQTALKAEPNDKDIQTAVRSMEGKIKNGQVSSKPATSQPASNLPNNLSAQQTDALRQKVNQAATYYQNGNYDAAINLLREVAAAAPNQADVQYALGQAYRAKGQNADARAALAQAVSLAPNNQDYKNALFDLDQQIAGGPGNKVADTFSNNGNYGNQAANQNNGPIGQLTPFTGDNNLADNQSGWQSAAPSARFYSGNSYFGPGFTSGYMPGYVSGGYSPYGYGGFGGGMGTAAMAGMAGMALGSMFGLMMSHHRR